MLTSATCTPSTPYPTPRATTNTRRPSPSHHDYSTSDPVPLNVDSDFSVDAAEPTLPHPVLLLSAAAQPAVAKHTSPVAAQPAVAVPTAAKPAITVYT